MLFKWWQNLHILFNILCNERACYDKKKISFLFYFFYFYFDETCPIRKVLMMGYKFKIHMKFEVKKENLFLIRITLQFRHPNPPNNDISTQIFQFFFIALLHSVYCTNKHMWCLYIRFIDKLIFDYILPVLISFCHIRPFFT